VVFDHGAGVPRCYLTTLTVTDDADAIGTTSLTISSGNTPPSVAITSPVNNSRYSLWYQQVAQLTATFSDTEQDPGELSCTWQTIVHHGNHVHPEPPDSQCSTSQLLSMHSGDCHDYFYEFRLTVSDPFCLSTTRSVYMYPNCCRPDFNNDGFLDGIDYDLFMAAFEAGLPNADYNADQFVDGIDYDSFANDFEGGCP
jgi:hypothetical protein